MKTYIVFLRGINVSGKNIIKMIDLKHELNKVFTDVVTYIQSGNIVLKSNLEKKEVEIRTAQIISDAFGLTIPVFCLDLPQVQSALENNPFTADAPPNKVFITFLNEQPKTELLTELERVDFGKDVFKIIKGVLYFYLPNGMADSKLSNTFFEKKLKIVSTGRNLNTINKVISIASTL